MRRVCARWVTRLITPKQGRSCAGYFADKSGVTGGWGVTFLLLFHNGKKHFRAKFPFSK